MMKVRSAFLNEVTIAILWAIRRHENQPLRAEEIMRSSNLSEPTLYRYLAKLERLGFITINRDVRPRHYSVLYLGRAYLYLAQEIAISRLNQEKSRCTRSLSHSSTSTGRETSE